MSSIYKSGKYTTNKDECTFRGITINGLTSPTTSIKDSVLYNGITADALLSSKAPYEVTIDDARSFIFRNYKNIFNNPPNITSENDTDVDSVIPNNQTSINIVFNFPSYLDNGLSSTQNKSYTIVVNGLSSKDTSLVQNSWSANQFNVNIPPRDITNDTLKSFILNTGDFSTTIFSNLPSNSTINSINITNRTGTSVTFNIAMSSVYKNGRLSSSVADCTFQNLVITNINPYNTSIKNTIRDNGIDADYELSSKAPYEVSNSDARSFIYRKYNEIFDNAPIISNENQIYISNIEVTSSTSISVVFNFPSYLLDGSNQTQNQLYTITINNLSSKDTNVNTTINNNNFNIDVPPLELDNNQLKKFITDTTNYQSILFNNLPSGSTINSVNITKKTGTSITFDIVTSSVYKNGKISINYIDCTFTGVTINNIDTPDTKMIENIKVNGINANSSNFSLSNRTPEQVTNYEAQSFIFNNYEQIFEYPPTIKNVNDIQIELITIIDSTSISVKFKSPIYLNDEINSNQTYELRIIGLTSSSSSEDALPWWIWFAVGGGALVLIIAIVSIIASSKRSSRNKSRMSTVMPPPRGSTANRLGPPSSQMAIRQLPSSGPMPKNNNQRPQNGRQQPPPNRVSAPMKPQFPGRSVSNQRMSPPINITNTKTSYAPKLKK